METLGPPTTSGVTRGMRWGRAAPDDTLRGVTPKSKMLLCTILCKIKKETTDFDHFKKKPKKKTQIKKPKQNPQKNKQTKYNKIR